jgi:hypothetical protein
MPPAREHRLARGGIGLFDEAASGAGSGGEIPLGRRGQFQPAIAGFGPVGADAEGDEPARRAAGAPACDGGAEGARHRG